MHLQIVDGLTALGFDSGWVVSGEEIVFWDNPEPQPSLDQILEAAENYVKPQPTVADKLQSVGLELNDLKVALGL